VNILFIQTDQQRRDSLPCYGNAVARTPHIDRLAEEGVVFENAFTPTPICGPARASLLTGLLPVHHGILFNCESGCAAGKDFLAPPVGFGRRLGEAGYTCRHVGKWHIGTKLTPAECGFEGQFYPGYGYPADHPHYLQYLQRLGVGGFQLRDPVHGRYPNGQRAFLLSAVQEGGVEASVPHYLAEQTIAALQSAAESGRPFFVACNFWGPHAPYILPASYMTMYDPQALPPPADLDDDLADKPALHRDYSRYWGIEQFTWHEWARLHAACYGYISLIDFQVGRILGALDRLGLAERTAVILTSDHGGMVGSHRLADKGPFLYDPVCRVPMIVRLPGGAGAGQRCERIVYNMDLMPTFLELAGLRVPEGLDAASLVPLLEGRADGFPDRPAAFCDYHGHQVPALGRMVRTQRLKYCFNACGRDELYDLQADPLELRNLLDDPARRDDLAALRAALAAELRRRSDPVLRFFEGTRMSLHRQTARSMD
jgi:arylsulfatase A-like enzyme